MPRQICDDLDDPISQENEDDEYLYENDDDQGPEWCPTCHGRGTVNPLTAPKDFFCVGTTDCPTCDGSGECP